MDIVTKPNLQHFICGWRRSSNTYFSPCESDQELGVHVVQQIFDVYIDSVETYSLVSEELHMR